MAKRKRFEKPTVIYREEFECKSDPRLNSVRTTFDEDKYCDWVEYNEPNKDYDVRFFVGQIDWKEVKR